MPFVKGQSGNPEGRKKGSGDKRLELRRMLEVRGVEVVDTLLDMAINDRDPVALKLVMERISPKPKSDSVNLGMTIDRIDKNTDMRTLVGDVLLRAIQGDLPDDQGKSVSSLIKSITDMDNKVEQDRRMERIESKLGIKNE